MYQYDIKCQCGMTVGSAEFPDEKTPEEMVIFCAQSKCASCASAPGPYFFDSDRCAADLYDALKDSSAFIPLAPYWGLTNMLIQYQNFDAIKRLTQHLVGISVIDQPTVDIINSVFMENGMSLSP